jgi:hypothetical protein
VVIVVGVLMTVLGWGAFVGGFVFTGFKVFDEVEAGIDPAGELDVVVDVPGEGTVELEAGERYQVVALGTGLTSVSGNSSDAGGLDVSRTAFAEPAVTVTGPDGEEVRLEQPGHDDLVSGPTDAVGIKELTAPLDGTYTLTVSGDGGAVSQVGIGEAEGLFEDVADYVVASIVIAVGGVVGSIGIVVLVGGFVWYALAR